MYAWISQEMYAEWAAQREQEFGEENEHQRLQAFLREIGTPALMGRFEAEKYNDTRGGGIWREIPQGAYVWYNPRYEEAFADAVGDLQAEEESTETAGSFGFLKKYFTFIQKFLA